MHAHSRKPTLTQALGRVQRNSPTAPDEHAPARPIACTRSTVAGSLRRFERGKAPDTLRGVGDEAAPSVPDVRLERRVLGPLPVLVAGAGPPLLYIGGLLPVVGVDSDLARRSAEYSARPFADIRTVIYANRRPGLPRGTTMAAIAAEHAEAISALGSGPVDVLGVSTGGSIAQQLAAEHPDSVRRLVLAGTGCRLSAMTRRMQERVARDIRSGRRDRALAAMLLGILFPGAQALARALAPLAARLGRNLDELGDMATTIEAEDEFDLASCGRAIEAPTLIVAGARDRFYPRPLLEQTQRLIPGSVLHVIPRRGHLTAMTAAGFAAAVRAHLQQGPSGSTV